METDSKPAMETRAKFTFQCGTPTQARKLARWLEGEGWPKALRATLEENFAFLRAAPLRGIEAITQGKTVRVDAAGDIAVEAIIFILEHAVNLWPSVPSPQGFSFSLAPPKSEDPEENLDANAYDGGAALIVRHQVSAIITGRYWLKLAMMQKDIGDDHASIWKGLHIGEVSEI